jgi:hypothetical protein
VRTIPALTNAINATNDINDINDINGINASATTNVSTNVNNNDSDMKNELKRYLMDLNMSHQPGDSGSMFKINSNVMSNEFPSQLNSSVFA